MGKWTWVSYDETMKYSVQHDMVCINIEKEIHDHSVSNSFKTFFTLWSITAFGRRHLNCVTICIQIEIIPVHKNSVTTCVALFSDEADSAIMTKGGGGSPEIWSVNHTRTCPLKISTYVIQYKVLTEWHFNDWKNFI